MSVMSLATSRKRSLPRDFFTPVSKKVAFPEFATQVAVQSSRKVLSGSCLAEQVPGLSILPEFITEAEEKTILDYLNGSECEWRTDLSRRTMHFGGTYCLYSPACRQAKPEIKEAPPLPASLDWIIDRFVEAGFYEEIQNKRPEYVIVNEYLSKMGISAHTENFSFHSPVVGLSLGSDDFMRFHELSQSFDGSVRSGKASKAPRTGKAVDIKLPGRSVCIMSADARWKWQHEIRPLKRPDSFKRVSLTFRVKKS